MLHQRHCRKVVDTLPVVKFESEVDVKKAAKEAGISLKHRNGKEKSISQLKYELRVNNQDLGMLGTAGSIAAGFIPGVGESMDAYDAYGALKEGNYGSAATIAGTGLLGLIPGVGDAAATAARTARRAGTSDATDLFGKMAELNQRDAYKSGQGGWNYKGLPEA